ncbi:MAG TPA: hypothetical protein VFB34_11010, partial [Chloroflexota bacterium]|nr:hypothetical protein [Chloroflexota bacterium]
APLADSLSFTPPSTVVKGGSLTLSATLTSSGSGVNGQNVTFTLAPLGSNQSCTASTDSSGLASCTLPTPVAAYPGTRTVTASFSGGSDSTGNYSYPAITKPSTINVLNQTLTYTGDSTAVTGGTITLSAQLLVDGSGVQGETLQFSLAPLGANQTCQGITNSTGTASCTITSVKAYPGTRSVTVLFQGDTLPSPAYPIQATTSTVNIQPFSLQYTGDSVLHDGSSATLSAKLTLNGSAVNGEPLTLTLAPLGANQSCNAQTGSDGTATCTISNVTAYPGPRTVTVSFAGDPANSPPLPAATLSTTVTVQST